jgi:hypothetical protein
MTALFPPPSAEAVDRYLKACQSPATRRAYDACLRELGRWAEARGVNLFPLSSDALAQFLAERADRGCAPSTVVRYAAPFSDAHRARGLPDPVAAPHQSRHMGGSANDTISL